MRAGAALFCDLDNTLFPTRSIPASVLAPLKAAPTSFLIDRAGNVVSAHLGFQKERAAEIEAAIVKLLEAPKSQ